jgi:serine protease Do
MRAGKAAGVAVTVLVVAALAAFWQVPSLVAAGQQAGVQSQQAGKPKVQTQTVTVTKKDSGEPMVVTVREGDGSEPQVVSVQRQAGGNPRVTTHGFVGEPLVAALAGGGPRLGVQVRDVAKEDVARLKLTTQSGVVIDEVMNESAAQKAGVKAGDVVVQFDGENVRSAMQLTRLVRETAEGRAVKMAVIRDGKRMDLDVTPAAADDEVSVFVNHAQIRGDVERQMANETKDLQGQMQRYRLERRVPAPGPPMPPGGTLQWKQEMPPPMPRGDMLQYFNEGTGNFAFSMGRGRLGVTVQELTPELATYFGVKDGLLVSAVQGDTPAAKAGIKAGDVIATVNGKTVASSSELIAELADKDGEVTIGLTRDKKPMTLKATLEARKAPARRTIVTGRPA